MGWVTGSRSSKFPKYTFSKSRRGYVASVSTAVTGCPLILPPFATNSVEKPGRLFERKHHADIAGRNPRRPGGVKFVALGKRHALVKGAIRSAHAGAEQRRCFDDEDAVQSTAPIVVGEQPKGHPGFIARDAGSGYYDDGHATTHLCAATVE